MAGEFLHHSPKEIAQGLKFNPNVPYERRILSVSWVPPDRLPVVFHTSSTDTLNQVSPAFCQSFDYSFSGLVIPVTYVLPFPHVNRVKGASEIWGPTKREAFDRTGIPYTYLKLKDEDRELGQIRMGSTMLDKFLLACANSGFVFKVNVAELNNGKTNKVLKEYISLMDLPVIDAYRFNAPSPVGLGMGGVETHLPLDIARPEFVGYQKLEEYLERIRSSSQRIRILETANALAEANPHSIMSGIFEQLVKVNREAIQGKNRLLVAVEPYIQNSK